MGLDSSGVKYACVSAGPLFPQLREAYAARNIHCRQCYGLADVGMIAYESELTDGMITDEGVIVEIVTPGTGTPVAEGEIGEVVVTSFNRDMPMMALQLATYLPIWPARARAGAPISVLWDGVQS